MVQQTISFFLIENLNFYSYLETSIDQLINGLTKQLLHNAFAVIASIDQVFANMLTTYKFQVKIQF